MYYNCCKQTSFANPPLNRFRYSLYSCHVYSAREGCRNVCHDSARSLFFLVFLFFRQKPQSNPPVNSYGGKVTLNIMDGNCVINSISVI